MNEYTGKKQQDFVEYCEMYEEAAAATTDDDGEHRYKGYTGANALSLYVDEKYGINAAANGLAAGALRKAL